MYWYEKERGAFSPVLSTRVRFARNLEGVPFPERLEGQEKKKVFEQVKAAFADEKVMAVPFDSLEPLVKKTYVETHLASPALAARGEGSGLILSDDGAVSLMVNEEDHLRLQVIMAGKEIQPAFDLALSWVKKAEERLPLAYRDGLGYLTACPTNLGAACRISVMIHLPALQALKQIPALTVSLNHAGFTVRGLFGEGSREGADMFQISNQSGRARTVEEILSAFSQVVEQVEQREATARKKLAESKGLPLEDSISRAVGLLAYSRQMSYEEFMRLYSLVRLGQALKLPVAEEFEHLDRLFIELMPSPLELSDKSLCDASARDKARSCILRQHWKKK